MSSRPFEIAIRAVSGARGFGYAASSAAIAREALATLSVTECNATKLNAHFRSERLGEFKDGEGKTESSYSPALAQLSLLEMVS